jgi:hypothetical protein
MLPIFLNKNKDLISNSTSKDEITLNVKIKLLLKNFFTNVQELFVIIAHETSCLKL